MTIRVGVVTFPGTLDDQDAAHAVTTVGFDAVPLWHADADVKQVDAVIVPGGFSYGDYLRCGAVAHLAPVMQAVTTFAKDGGPVLGICNGFQVLCEAGLLPGALLRNAGLKFVCRPVPCVVSAPSRFTADYPPGATIVIPAKHGEGRYYAPKEALDALEANNQVVLRYAPDFNPNGSLNDIAGVTNAQRNVVGVMPHPEHAVDPALIGGTDGRGFFTSLTKTSATTDA
jgi:phosphoribosylformylglycinamidine synthase